MCREKSKSRGKWEDRFQVPLLWSFPYLTLQISPKTPFLLWVSSLSTNSLKKALVTWKATGRFCPPAFPGTVLTLKRVPKQNKNAEMEMLCRSRLSTDSEKGILHLHSDNFQQILSEVFVTSRTDAHLSSTTFVWVCDPGSCFVHDMNCDLQKSNFLRRTQKSNSFLHKVLLEKRPTNYLKDLFRN